MPEASGYLIFQRPPASLDAIFFISSINKAGRHFAIGRPLFSEISSASKLSYCFRHSYMAASSPPSSRLWRLDAFEEGGAGAVFPF